MPNEPSALPDILAELPDAADYDAVCAAFMATERGRRFLTEFAARHRHADTAMVIGAIARVEAIIRGDVAPHLDAAGDLMEIAAAVDRIQAALAAGPAPASEVAAAVERLQDIAFMLHERPFEATLCDALDAAVRDVAAAGTRVEAGDAGLRRATELLAALADRLRRMMARAPAGVDRRTDDAAAEAAPDPGLFALAANDGETFAQAVAALTASLPALADAPSEPVAAASAAPAADDIEATPVAVPSGEGAAAPVPIAPAPDLDDDPAPAAEAKATDQEAIVPEVPETGAPPPLSEVSLSESVLNEAFADHFANAGSSGQAETREATAAEPAPAEPPHNEATLPAHEYSAGTVAGPEEDPADLFEPQPVADATTASTPEAAAPADAPAPAPAAVESEPPRAVPPPPMRAIPRPPGSDPLAALRELSEEELIALFS